MWYVELGGYVVLTSCYLLLFAEVVEYRSQFSISGISLKMVVPARPPQRFVPVFCGGRVIMDISKYT